MTREMFVHLREAHWEHMDVEPVSASVLATLEASEAENNGDVFGAWSS